MADKPETTGRDYGHRTYMNSSGYWDAMRRPTEKQYDNRIKRPHSDDKKPYMEDDYPEMEYFYTPYDPPNFVPPGIPDDPRIPPNVPDNPSTGDDPDTPGGPDFTGCIFGVPQGPLEIAQGDTTFSGIKVTEGDPLISIKVNYGPAKLLTTFDTINNCVGALTPNCIVGAQALEGFDPEDYHQIGDYAPVQVVAKTASGWECAWDFLVSVCPPEVALEWDTDNSAETIGRSGEASIYIIGGAPPFEWSVSGEGYTLQRTGPTGSRSNKLYASGTSCGAATITVVDGCGDTVTGYVRNTTGHWQIIGDDCCVGVGTPVDSAWNIDCIGGILENHWPIDGYATVGKYMNRHHETLYTNTGESGGPFPDEGACNGARMSDCGGWTTPCLAYQSSWNLTSDNCDWPVRWKDIYDECAGGKEIHGQCHQLSVGTNWDYYVATHSLGFRVCYEWQCN